MKKIELKDNQKASMLNYKISSFKKIQGEIMKSIQKLLFTVVVTMGLNVTHVIAEEVQQSTEQISTAVQIKELDQKIASIQAQIDELKAKGLKNLTKKERVEYGSLKKELLAAMRAKTAKQDETIAKQKIIRAKQNETIEKQKEKQEEIRKTNAMIDSIAEKFK